MEVDFALKEPVDFALKEPVALYSNCSHIACFAFACFQALVFGL